MYSLVIVLFKRQIFQTIYSFVVRHIYMKGILVLLFTTIFYCVEMNVPRTDEISYVLIECQNHHVALCI